MSQSSFPDHMPGDEDDGSMPPSPTNPFTGKSCPVCGKLNVDMVGKDSARSLEYYIDPSERNHDLLLEWTEECYLCKLVYDLDQHWSEQGDNTQDMKYVGFKYRYACGRNGSAPLQLKILADWDSFLIERMIFIAVHADPLSKSAIARMKHWVARCDTNDAKCKVQETALPTRVLDVGDSQNIRLCETGGRPGAYTALSHCWGLSNKTFLTTPDTIADMKAAFAIEKAPATFRDAMSITRNLGFRYIWIDSLCIIQYDTADWSREAAKMGSVYANASLTIAAASAEDDNDGFLHPRIDALTSLRIMSSTGRLAQVYLQTQHDGFKARRFREEPLDARGWTLQEQRLSRRSLRYGSTEMSWDCQCFSLHESQTDHYDGERYSMEMLKPHPTAYSRLSYFNWYRMVSEFTARHLRYDTDKMPALSGVATEVAKFHNGTYYAGLWWEDMAMGMLWFRHPAAELNKPPEYIAPSWSWASLNGWKVIYHNQPSKITLPNVVFHECPLKYKSDDDLHGEIKSGWLGLSAPVVKLVQHEDPFRWRINNEGLEIALGFAHLDVRDIGMEYHGDELEQWDYRRSRKGNFETRGVFDLKHKDRTEILGLFLMVSETSSQTAQQDSLNGFSLYGILIDYSNKRLAYKRVGYFKVMRLEAGEASQILEGAEMRDIRLY